MKLGKDTERRDQNYDFIICTQYSQNTMKKNKTY